MEMILSLGQRKRVSMIG